MVVSRKTTVPRAASRSILGQEHRAAARREHDAGGLGQRVDRVPLADSEALLAFTLENVGDIHARARLDLGVAVGERQAEAAGERAPDRGLAGAHRADQKNALFHQAAKKTRPPGGGRVTVLGTGTGRKPGPPRSLL